MDKKILLIDNKASFMTNAIVMNVKKEGYEVAEAEATVKSLNEKKDESFLYILYLGPYIEDIPEFIVYLKDLVIEEEKILYVIGDEKEVEILKKTIPDDRIGNIFKRPLDMGKLVEALDTVMIRNSELQRRKSILLVDDDPVFLQMMRTHLIDHYRVTVVSSGMQAITFLANNTPDLILLDYEMPVTSGPQVLEMIRSEARTSTTPVIFLTGKDDKESVMKVLSLKPDGYLLKTMDKNSILSAVADFFESKKAD